jgi:hypothetical protein
MCRDLHPARYFDPLFPLFPISKHRATHKQIDFTMSRQLHTTSRIGSFLSFAVVSVAIIAGSAALLEGMDWETASEVACCVNRPGYERDATRILGVLTAHEIYSKIIYFKRVNGVDAVTEDTRHADRFGVFVDAKNARSARKVVAEQKTKGLRITLCPSKQHEDDQ